jgi:uncharacterized membrane-anchored protein YitT (DUF2179 family)
METPERKSQPVYIELIVMAIGCFISAFGYNALVIPAHLLSGGLTGISQIIHHFVPVNVGIFYLVLNIPLLFLGYKYLGKKFSLYTIYGTVLLSFFLYIIPIKHIWTDNTLLSAVFGGIITSFGTGIVLRMGGSQGGLDIISRIISKHKNISVGKANLLMNVVIIIISGFIFNSEIALYTIVFIFTSMRTSDVILSHVNRISVLIVTDKGNEVSQEINDLMHRGTTVWNANGGYTHKDKIVLFCVLVEGELTQLQTIVKAVDPSAFVSIISTQNVIGRFKHVW